MSLPPMRSRHTPRLSGYDYSRSGLYFVTIITANRECLFGKINNEAMQLNTYGAIVTEQWLSLSQHFPSVTNADFIVMPNHLHGIIIIETTSSRILLATIVGGFKSGATRQINTLRESPGAIIWQRSYHDHIIRSEKELTRIQ